MLNYAEFMELANKVFCTLQANDSSSHIYYAWRLMSGKFNEVVSLDDLCNKGEEWRRMVEVCDHWYGDYARTVGSYDDRYLTIERDYMRDCLAHSLPETLNNLECYANERTYQIALMLSLVDDDTRDRLMTTDPIGVILAKWFFSDSNPDIREIIGEPDCYEILRYNAK